ncbi:MAG: hypothetical protein ABJA90_05590 [Ginsengibacter sp.]
MIRKLITIFFLAVFLTQVIPVKQLGQLLAGATMTEELPETGSSKSNTSFLDGKWFIVISTHLHNQSLYNTALFQYIHFSETLPFDLSSDVQSPPPDSFC